MPPPFAVQDGFFFGFGRWRPSPAWGECVWERDGGEGLWAEEGTGSGRLCRDSGEPSYGFCKRVTKKYLLVRKETALVLTAPAASRYWTFCW